MATAPPSPAVYRRRRLVAVAAGARGRRPSRRCSCAAAASDRAGARRARQAAATPKPPSCPGGGRRLLPDRRIVAFYGAPQDDELGELGIGTPASAARRLERQARAYAQPDRPVLPAMELIAVTAAAHPGEGGRYNTRQDDAVIDRYLRAARKAKALLVLDIQPGRSDFFTEATRLSAGSREPDVGLALDPEWRMGPGEVPGQGDRLGRGARGQRGLGVAGAARRAQRAARRSCSSSTSSPTTWSTTPSCRSGRAWRWC